MVIGERSFAALRMTRSAVGIQIQEGVVSAEDDKDTRLIASLHRLFSIDIIQYIILDAGG